MRRLSLALFVSVLAACGPQAPLPLGASVVPTEGDAVSLERLVARTDAALADLENSKDLFAYPGDAPLPVDAKAQLLDLYARVLDHVRALESVKLQFRGYRANRNMSEGKAWVMGYAAWVLELKVAVELVKLVDERDAYVAALDAASPERGLSGGEYSQLDALAWDDDAADRLESTFDQIKGMYPRVRGQQEPLDLTDPFVRLTQGALAAGRETMKTLDRRGYFASWWHTADELHDAVFEALFPLQTAFAAWAGDTRLRYGDQSMISAEQLDTLRTLLEPGDILVERRNWYVSNVGLPGFWPHAELYVGTPDELAAAFDEDPDVRAAYPEGFRAFLEKTYPETYADWAAQAADGEPHRVTEAVSEGAIFSSLHEAAGADYLGAMRPRLSKLEKARAVARAFASHGKPYDFDFDFLTDDQLVCTELVFKSYQSPSALGRSLDIPLARVLGRTTLPANDLVKSFDSAAGTASQQLDFVAFLDGHEATRTAAFATEAAFRASWQRPRWDFSQP